MKSPRLLVVAALAALAGLLAVASTVHAQTAVVQSVNNLFNKAQTYTATTKVTLATTPTWVAELKGSATKTVYVKSVDVACSKTTAGYGDVVLSVLTAPSTSGTSATVSQVAHDTTNATATATLTTWTANPNIPGSGTSMVRVLYPFLSVTVTPAQTSSVQDGRRLFDSFNTPSQYLVLRGVAQAASIGLESQTLTGGVCYFTFTWMEQ